MRCLPNLEYYASWYRFKAKCGKHMGRTMPRHIYDGLSDLGKKLAEEVVAAPGKINRTISCLF